MVLEKNRAHFYIGTARLRDRIGLPLTSLEPAVDLNYLYQRYCISLHLAENAACSCSRIAHLKLAEGYAAQIEAAKCTDQPEMSQ